MNNELGVTRKDTNNVKVRSFIIVCIQDEQIGLDAEKPNQVMVIAAGKN